MKQKYKLIFKVIISKIGLRIILDFDQHMFDLILTGKIRV